MTVDVCTHRKCIALTLDDHWLWLSGSNVTSCVSISMQRAITIARQSRKPPQNPETTLKKILFHCFISVLFYMCERLIYKYFISVLSDVVRAASESEFQSL